jgi:anti-sigma regulatory factor (Ser/Thr protein kinase)
MTRTRRFSRQPGSVRAARRFVTGLLDGTGAEARDAVELMVSELSTNCIRHTGTPFVVSVRLAVDEIHVQVTDTAGGAPVMRSPGPEEPTGRGLRIVNMLASAWGVEHPERGATTVWFTLATPAHLPAPLST